MLVVVISLRKTVTFFSISKKVIILDMMKIEKKIVCGYCQNLIHSTNTHSFNMHPAQHH
jgi:hypothetical protein